MLSIHSQRRGQRTAIGLIVVLAVLISVMAFTATTVAASSRTQSPGQQQSSADGYRIYIVKKGDTLRKISRRFDVPVRKLVRINKIANPNRIRVGQRLRIPVTRQPTPTPPPVPTWPRSPAAIVAYSPVVGGQYHSPIEVTGRSLTFEGVVNLRLIDDDTGLTLAERHAMGGGVEHAFFHTYLRFWLPSDAPTAATLELFEVSAKSGDEINKVEIPLTLIPGQRVLDVDQPAVGDVVCAPFDVTGYSLTFEGTVNLELQNLDGDAELSDFTTGGGVIYDEFFARLDPRTDLVGPALISVYEISARDGSHIDETRTPVIVAPAAASACK